MIDSIRQILVVLLIIFVGCIEGSCMRDSYEIKLSGPITIDANWTEFRPQGALKADKDIQWVLLELEPPFKDNSSLGPGTKGGVLMPDGEVENPEIEVVDQYGNAFKFVWSGTMGGFSVISFPTRKNYHVTESIRL